MTAILLGFALLLPSGLARTGRPGAGDCAQAQYIPPASPPVCANCGGAGCEQCQRTPGQGGWTPEERDAWWQAKKEAQEAKRKAQEAKREEREAKRKADKEKARIEAEQKQFAAECDKLRSAFYTGLAPITGRTPEWAEWVVSGDAIGSGPLPEPLKLAGAVTDDEWRQVGKAEAELRALYDGAALSADQAARVEQLEAQRTRVWEKAVSAPGLKEEDRSRLVLNLPTLPAKLPPPTVTASQIKSWQSAPLRLLPATDAPAPESVNPLAQALLQDFTVEKPASLIEVLGEEFAESSFGEDAERFGDFLGLGRIAIAYKEGGVSSAAAETFDYMIGKISYPQATLAVEGGRVVASINFQAMNSFMRQALASVGGEFNEDEFYQQVQDESTVGQRAVMEVVGYGAK